MNKQKPLWRKENKVSLSSHYNVTKGSEYRYDRHKKVYDVENLPMKTSMKSGNYGRDYKPFIRFMISKVGQDYNKVCSEAKPRMDDKFDWVLSKIFRTDTISINHGDEFIFRWGESSYFPHLIVDDNGLIQLANPNVNWQNPCKVSKG